MDETLDALVRRVDEDRWLASRFAPQAARARLVALYALNYEIARTPESVSNPALGDIKLAWWAEAVDEIYAGKPARAHPALQAYAKAVAEAGLEQERLHGIIWARGNDLESTPFETWTNLDLYLDATAGGLMRLASACLTDAEPIEDFGSFVTSAGRAWGYCGLLRSLPRWTAQGRTFFPKEALASVDPAPEMVILNQSEGARVCYAEALERGMMFYKHVRSLAPNLPSALFPAFGYLALLPRYFSKLQRGSGKKTQALLLTRQIALIRASATGKI